MSTPAQPIYESFQKLIHDLISALQKAQDESLSNAQSFSQTSETIMHHCTQLIMKYNAKIEELFSISQSMTTEQFEKEWCMITWPLLSILNRLSARPGTNNEEHVQMQLNQNLVILVNKSRHVTVPPTVDVDSNEWQAFWEQHQRTLNVLHDLYSQFDRSSNLVEEAIKEFASCELPRYLQLFSEICISNHTNVLQKLRLSQVDRMMNKSDLDTEAIHLACAYFSNMLYTLGILAARLQGLRWEALQSKNRFSSPDPVGSVIKTVYNVVERLVCDALLPTKPSTTAILVTNNLFPFHCASLAPGLIFKQFDVQIVSEETAISIQNHVASTRRGYITQTLASNFLSAALLAVKPTSGVKRNNATANADGGNTAHKKSDVNSRESVVIQPSWDDPSACWQAHYPHLLCTTRQKDTVLLDTRLANTGKRPLFYFYTCGMMYGPSGDICYVRTLSLPFTIATRRNQDCQVQRMMSSYTATCFWLYGLRNVDGLILNWCAKGVEWSRFVNLYTSYFLVNAAVKRPLSAADFQLLEEKLDCDYCRSSSQHSVDGERLVTFKNVLCPHLRYDVDNQNMRFSIWRGLLEVLQIYQDGRTTVRTLWNDYILLGFNDIAVIEKLMDPHVSVMCLRISYVVGGSICISMKTSDGTVVHLEPIDLKRLQAKSIFEYVVDIADSAKISYVITARNDLMSIEELIRRYKICPNKVEQISVLSNITHRGRVESVTNIKFTPLRIAVVTALESMNEAPSVSSIPMIESPAIGQELLPSHQMNYQNSLSIGSALVTTTYEPAIQEESFENELVKLMKRHHKTSNDLYSFVGYVPPPPTYSTYLVNNSYMPMDYE
ncbi:unnamed protein product [Auanema sp. JU1783]|nr:unnamed protein product [Auanema sp. JU1783]